MVVTCLPSALDSGATQDRMAFPSRCTVHAPHSAIPQPNFVPVISSESRRTHSKGVAGSTSTCTGFTFTKKFVMSGLPPLFLNTGWDSDLDGITARNGTTFLRRLQLESDQQR